MRVLVLSPGGMGEHYHGPAISTYRLFKRMKERHGISIDLLHGTKRQNTFDGVVDAVIPLPLTDPVNNRVLDALNKVRFIRAADQWISKNASRYDVLYAPAVNLLTLKPALTAERHGLRSVCRVAAASELEHVTPLKAILKLPELKGWAINGTTRVIAISRFIEDKLRTMGVADPRIAHIPNGADCDRFRPCSPEEKCQARESFRIPLAAKFVIVCVGAVCSRKGQHLLVEALGALPADHHLLLVGPKRDTEYETKIDQLVSTLSLQGRVHREFFVDNIEKAYFASDLFALPSLGEGMPNALVEAMASGLPCIGTPISGITDLIAQEGNRGRLVSRDVNDIAQAVRRYSLDNGYWRLHGAAARDYVFINQSDVRIADKMAALLRSASWTTGFGASLPEDAA